MPPINRQENIDRLAVGDVGNTAEKGAALEGVVAATICQLHGVTVLRANALDVGGVSEIDILLSNMRYPESVGFLPSHILVECKNWQAPVNTATLRAFTGKLRDCRLEVGILVAANGITGDQQDRTAAHGHLRDVFMRDGIAVIVLTRADIENLEDTEQLDGLLRNKYAAAIMGYEAF